MDEYYEKLARQQASREQAEAAIQLADEALAAARERRPETARAAPEPPPPVKATVRASQPAAAPVDWSAWQRWAADIARTEIRKANIEMTAGVGEALAAYTGEVADALRAEFAAKLTSEMAKVKKQFRKELKAAEQARAAEVTPTPTIRRIL